jgi:hypothetical protein
MRHVILCFSFLFLVNLADAQEECCCCDFRQNGQIAFMAHRYGKAIKEWERGQR